MDNIDMRDAFFNGIYEIIRDNKNAIILTADHGAFVLSKIEKDFPKQFFNVGISEQNMISTAAGLAKCGKIVYVYSINNFITLRSLEQVNIDLCQMNLNVNLIGSGAGFTYATDGPTHQGVQDMQVMRILPNLEIHNVTDSVNSYKLAKSSYKNNCPKYFRIEKNILEQIYNDSFDINIGINKVVDSDKSWIVSTGFMTHTAIKVSKKLNNIGVIDIHRIKPFPEKVFIDYIKDSKNIISLEENTYAGGLGERIGFTLAKNNISCNFLPIALDNKHCFVYGDRKLLHRKNFIDSDSIIDRIKKNNICL